MRAGFGAGAVAGRLHDALPALVVIALAAVTGRTASALSSYADGRITPRLTTEADSALVAAVCGIEAAARAEDGCADRQEAAEMGVVRSHVMIQDAPRLTAAAIRLVTASGVLTVLHPLLLPLLLLAVVPAGVGAVLQARVTYETHYANVGDGRSRRVHHPPADQGPHQRLHRGPGDPPAGQRPFSGYRNCCGSGVLALMQLNAGVPEDTHCNRCGAIA